LFLAAKTDTFHAFKESLGKSDAKADEGVFLGYVI